MQPLLRVSGGDSVAEAEVLEADSFEVSDATLEQGVRLLNVLSSEDAVRIFLYAKRGIESSTQAIKVLGMTQKRYYSRLKGLIEVGLLEKVEGTYQYTALGKIVHKLGLYLIGVLKNVDRIELMNSLSKAKSLSNAEKRKFEKMISEQTEVGGLLNSVLSEKTRGKVKEIISYEELVEKIVEHINQSQKSVLLASNYLDTRVIDSSMKSINRGVVLKVLMGRDKLSGKLNKLRLMLSPKLIGAMLEFLGSPINPEDVVREIDISFSFCIIDNLYCFFELPSLMGSEFSIAFFLVDEDTSRKFTELFEKLWEIGEVNTMFKFINKLKDG